MEKHANQFECETAKALPAGTLRKAKKLGCPGFYANGRVDWDLIGPWLKENSGLMTQGEGEESLTTLRAQSLKLDIALKELELKKAEDRMVERAYVLKYLKAVHSMAKNALAQKLQNELPPLLVGKTVAEITAELEKACQEICTTMENLKV